MNGTTTNVSTQLDTIQQMIASQNRDERFQQIENQLTNISTQIEQLFRELLRLNTSASD